MHIAIVCRYMTAFRGGHERYIIRLAKALTAAGHFVTAFSGAFDHELDDVYGLECAKVPYIRFPQWLRYLSFNRSAKKAVSARSGEFDLVFSTEYVTFGDIYRAGAGIARAEIENYGGWPDRISPKNNIKVFLQKQIMENGGPEKIIVNSRLMKKQVLKYYNVDAERVEIVYNGIDTGRFTAEKHELKRAAMRGSLGLDDDDFLCLTIGTNYRRKGIDRALDILSFIPDSKLKLAIIGEAGKGIKNLPESGKKRLLLAGYTPEIQHYYAASDLLIAASRYDPAPNVILESLACQLPVALSRECGLAELIENKRCGFLFKDTGELARTVDFFRRIRGSSEHIQIQQEASNIGSKFTMERHMDAITEIFKSVKAGK